MIDGSQINWNIIAVDFDGTLCENKYPKIGEPNEQIIAYIRGMKKTRRPVNSLDLPFWETPPGCGGVV